MALDLTTPGEAGSPGDAIDRARIRAWQVSDEDIVGAETWEQAIAYATKDLGLDEWNLDEPCEVDLSMTLRRDAEDPKSEVITLAQVIAESLWFPCLLCSTEY
jgi:hypothetical protein